MPKNSDSQPWERRDGEGIKAYEAFSLYLQMGSDRSLRKVAQQLGKSKTLIDRWSSTHSWVERVGAYEEHLQEEAYKTARKKSRKMADRHISIAMQMQELALKKLKEYGYAYMQFSGSADTASRSLKSLFQAAQRCLRSIKTAIL